MRTEKNIDNYSERRAFAFSEGENLFKTGHINHWA
jgi:hypothetical protein